MKKINDLTVTVTYTVGLHGVEVSEKIYDALNALADKGRVNCDLMNLDERVCKLLFVQILCGVFKFLDKYYRTK